MLTVGAWLHKKSQVNVQLAVLVFILLQVVCYNRKNNGDSYPLESKPA